jgi:ATP-dependent DNA ligase
MLLEAREEAFNDERYIFEPKWDGWRILIHKQGDRVEAFTRHGNLVTEKFPELNEIASSIRAHSAVLDCEGICLRDGRAGGRTRWFCRSLQSQHRNQQHLQDLMIYSFPATAAVVKKERIADNMLNALL